MPKFNEEQLRSAGFEEGPDGQWHKKDSSCPNTTSRPDAKCDKKEPKHRARPQSEESAASRFVAIVTVRTVRSRDYDGLGAAAKHYLDALIQECGLCKDDSPEHLEVVLVPQRVRSFDAEETIIEIWEAPKL
ncbi:hypothetical protein OAG69_00105 [bacterium]|nr:hypothetical protein [bacterium]